MRRHEAATAKERSVLNELEKMGSRLDAAKRAIRNIKGKIDKANRDIRKAERELKQALSDLKVTGQRLGIVVRAWSIARQALPLRRMWDGHRSVRQDLMFASLATSESSVIEALTMRSELVKKKKSDLERQKKDQQRLRAKEQDHFATLEREKKARDAWLKDVRQEKASSRAAVIELKDAQKQMEELLALLRQELKKTEPTEPGGVELEDLKGRLPWPVIGRVVEKFGVHRHPIFRVEVMHQGVTVASEEGAAVKAVADGRVVFANTVKGYGETVILQHGGEMYTLYGQLGLRSVTVGEEIKEGGILGYVGEGLRGEPTSYFEVRKGAKALDPLDWLRKR